MKIRAKSNFYIDVISKLIKRASWLKYILNRYFLTGFVFFIWMFFFDQNSYFIHKELNKQISDLKRDKKYYSSNLEKENEKLMRFKNNPAEIERIAREKFFLKKDNEDIFIIEQQIKKPQEK